MVKAADVPPREKRAPLNHPTSYCTLVSLVSQTKHKFIDISPLNAATNRTPFVPLKVASSYAYFIVHVTGATAADLDLALPVVRQPFFVVADPANLESFNAVRGATTNRVIGRLRDRWQGPRPRPCPPARRTPPA